MNIFYSTGMHSTKYGGIEHMLVKLAKELSAKGHKIIIQYERSPASQSFVDDIKASGGSIVIINTGNHLVKGFFDIYKCIRKSKIQIVHTNFSPSQELCVLAGRLAGVKKIISHFRGIDTEKPRTDLKLWFVTRFSDINLTVSEAVKQNLTERGAPKDKVRVVYNGVETSPVLRSKKEACDLLHLECPSSVIICIAWDDPVKGVDLLLEAFSNVSRKYQETELLIAGEACSSIKNKELAERLGIKDRVRWLGVRNDIPTLINCCDIYVQPSRMEAFSRAVLEVMAAGKPVVAFKVGGLSEEIEDGITGILALPESVESLSKAIIKLLENPKLREEMGGAGRQRVLEVFDINKEVSQIIGWYENI